MQTKNPEKKWPICPQQILTFRKGCPYSSESDELGSFTVNKCSFCGIMTESTALGRLYTLFRSIHLPIVLYERVHCPKAVYSDTIQKMGQYRKGKFSKTNFYEYNNCIYHSIDCDEAYDSLDTDCYALRNIDPVRDNQCIENDLSQVHEIYSICERGETLKLETWGDVNVEGEGFYYRTIICKYAIDRDGNSTPLIEMLIPLFGDSPEKDPLLQPLAILFVGQLNPNCEYNDLSRLDDKSIKETVVEVLEKHGKTLANFVGNILHRTNRRRMEYLFAKQYQLQKAFETAAYEDTASVKKVIKKLISEICDDFDLKSCLLFTPDLSRNVTLYDAYEAIDCIRNGNTVPNVAVALNKIPAQIKNGLIDTTVDISEAIVGVGRNENCDIFMYRNKESIGIFLWLEWNKLSSRSRNHGVNFFNALLSMFFSQMMARVAEIKKENMVQFIESTRHDLGIKLGTLALHNESFNRCLSSIAFFCRQNEENQKKMGTNYQSCADYHKDMDGLFNALGFLRSTLDSPEMKNEVRPESFYPYTKFLFNLREQYNKDPWRRGKIVFCYAPREKEPELIADSAMVERIIGNLLHNANKYAYEGTNIYLESYYDFKKNIYIFNVTNFGAGIAIDNVFEWGVQAERNGSGYGLAIALAYAKMHGGTLDITSGLITNPDEKPVSPIGIPSLILSDILEGEEDGFIIPDRIKSEKTRLKRAPSRNELAREYEKFNLYEEIVSEDAKDYFMRTNPTPGRLRAKGNPTYKVTFTAKIPMQTLKQEGANK